MKKLLGLITISLLGSFAVYAQVSPAPIAPDSIDNIIGFVLGIAAGIPAVGPYLVIVMKVLAVLAASLTAISASLMAVSKAFNVVGLSSVSGLIDKVLPYVQYASIFNVQKKA